MSSTKPHLVSFKNIVERPRLEPLKNTPERPRLELLKKIPKNSRLESFKDILKNASLGNFGEKCSFYIHVKKYPYKKLTLRLEPLKCPCLDP